MVDGTAELAAQTKPAQTEAMAEVRGLKKQNEDIKTTIKTLVEDHVQALHDHGRHEDVAELRTVANERFGLADASAHATRTEGKIAREVGEAIVGKIDQLNDSDGEVVTTDATVQHDADVSSRGAAIDSHMRSMVQVVEQVSDDGVVGGSDLTAEELAELEGFGSDDVLVGDGELTAEELAELEDFGVDDGTVGDGDLTAEELAELETFGSDDGVLENSELPVAGFRSALGSESESVDLAEVDIELNMAQLQQTHSEVEKVDQIVKRRDSLNLKFREVVGKMAGDLRNSRTKEINYKKQLESSMQELQEAVRNLELLQEKSEYVQKELESSKKILREMKIAQAKMFGGSRPEAAPKPKAAAAVVAEVNAGDDAENQAAKEAFTQEIERHEEVIGRRVINEGSAVKGFSQVDMERNRRLEKSINENRLKLERSKAAWLDLTDRFENGECSDKISREIEKHYNLQQQLKKEIQEERDKLALTSSDEKRKQILKDIEADKLAAAEFDKIVKAFFLSKAYEESSHLFSRSFQSVVAMLIGVRTEKEFTLLGLLGKQNIEKKQVAEQRADSKKEFQRTMDKLDAEGTKVLNEALAEIRERRVD